MYESDIKGGSSDVTGGSLALIFSLASIASTAPYVETQYGTKYVRPTFQIEGHIPPIKRLPAHNK